MPATEIIRTNPHPLFDKLAERGYELWYYVETYDGLLDDRGLEVQVRLHGEVIGSANFDEDGSDGAYCQHVNVDPKYQRQGIANAVYVFAEKALNRTLWDFWGSFPDTPQSKSGRALWAQPNQPFGNPPRSTA
jgi:ribosomal protein S18 acetylase RimI-like enzyme